MGYATNLIVKDMMGAEFLPPKCLIDDKYQEWSSEKIYEDLKKKMPQMTKQETQDMINRMTGNKSLWGKRKGKQAKEDEGKMKQIAQQAAHEAKERGNMPSFLKRLFEEMEPKEDWRKVLMEYIMPYMNDYNFSRPDRRYLDAEFFLPDNQDGEKIDWVAIAVDTSGSISGKELNHFISEIKAILGACDKVKIKLTFCDADATPFVTLEEFDTATIKPVGGGGTSFKPPFDLVKKEDSMPQALLYFTDMMGDFPSKQPDYDVVWISTTSREVKAPFGKQLEYHV